MPQAFSIGTSQPNTRLEIKGLLEPKFKCGSTVGGGPIRDPPHVFFHKSDRLRVFEVRNQKVPLDPHNFFLAVSAL